MKPNKQPERTYTNKVTAKLEQYAGREMTRAQFLHWFGVHRATMFRMAKRGELTIDGEVVKVRR